MTLRSEPAREGAAPGFRLRERASARARHVRVEIQADGSVLLVYPRRGSRAQALAFVREREPWIREQLARLHCRSGQVAPAPGWQGEDWLWFGGERLALHWARAPQRQPSLHRRDDGLWLLVPRSTAPVAAALERQLRLALRRVAQTTAAALVAEESVRLGQSPSDLRVNDPARQWGSCNPGGRICLSWRLLLAPPDVFRYVVVHELCHLRHADHSPRFWAAVARQLPDYERARRWLREHGGGLHAWLPRSAAAAEEAPSGG